MEIKYDLTQNYLKLYNEANGVMLCKKRLIKNNNMKVRTYMQYIDIYALAIIATGLIFLTIGNKLDLNTITNLSSFIVKFGIVFWLAMVANLLIYEKSKMNNKIGTIEINKDGIIDKSDKGHQIQFKYDSIEMIVIVKHVIVIVTNMPIMILIRNEEKEKVIETIKKYSNILILDKSKN